MSKLEEEKRRGEHAQRLLNDELLNEVLDVMEKNTLTMWEATPARDVDGREHLHRFYLACRKFRNELQSVLDTGRMATQQLSAFQKAKDYVANLVKQ